MTTLAEIAHAVCAHYDVTSDELFRRTRGSRSVVQARQVFMWLAKDRTIKSYPEIARYLGRDHTTVIHGVRATDNQLATDDRFYSEVMAIKGEFR